MKDTQTLILNSSFLIVAMAIKLCPVHTKMEDTF